MTKSNIIEFVSTLGRMTTPEDEVNTEGMSPEDAEKAVEEHIAEMSVERLYGEYTVFMEMIREAREIMKSPNGEIDIPDGDYNLVDNSAWLSIGGLSVRLIDQQGELTITVYETGKEFTNGDQMEYLLKTSVRSSK